MKNLLILVLVLIAGNATAQDLLWAKGLFGENWPGRTYLTTDNASNVYVVGSFTSTMDLDPGTGVSNITSVNSATETYIVKLNAGGNFTWGRQLVCATGSDECRGEDIVVDGSGNVYVVGGFNGTVDFDPGVSTASLTGNADVFILKLDAAGNFAWVKKIGSSGSDEARSIVIDNAGNLVIAGSYENTVDFDPGTATNNLTSVGMADVFILKMDVQGNYIWAKSKGSAGYGEGVNEVSVDAAGNIYGAATVNDASTIFKLDASGNAQWDKQITNTGSNFMDIRSVAVDPNGNVFAAGTFSSTVDFDPGTGTFNLTPGSNSNVFILKLDNNGNFAWAKYVNGTGIDIASRVAADIWGNIYVTGSFAGTSDFDPGPGMHNLVSGPPDIFLLKLYPSGIFMSAGQMGGPIDDHPTDMRLDNSGNVHLTGIFRDTADFDPGAAVSQLVSPIAYTIFVVKLASTLGIDGIQTSPVPSIYPNPANDKLMLNLQNHGYSTCIITNNIGQQILSEDVSSGKAEIDISLLAPGVYYLLIEGTGGKATAKFTKL